MKNGLLSLKLLRRRDCYLVWEPKCKRQHQLNGFPTQDKFVSFVTDENLLQNKVFVKTFFNGDKERKRTVLIILWRYEHYVYTNRMVHQKHYTRLPLWRPQNNFEISILMRVFAQVKHDNGSTCFVLE